MTGSLSEIWQKRVKLFKEAKADWNAQQKTKLGPATAKHLRNFIQEFAQHGDFRRARGETSTRRYGCLAKLADMLPDGLSEPYRAQLRLLRSAWAEYTQQQQTTTLTRHRVDEDAFEDIHRQELQNFIFDFHSRDCFDRAFRGSVSVNECAESTRQKTLVHLLGLHENDVPVAYVDMWRTLKLAHEVHEKDVQLAQAQEAYREENRRRRQAEEAQTRELKKVEEAHQRARLEAEEAQQRTREEAAEAHQEKSLEVKPQGEASRRSPKERVITALEQERLKAFADSLHEHGDLNRARGESSPMSPKYQTLAKMRRYDKARIPPPLWSAFDKLIACWPKPMKPPDQATLNPRYFSSPSRVDQSDAAQRPHLVPAKRASSPATTLDADVDDRATKTQRVDPPSIRSDEDHLIAFFAEYKKHRDFDRARGDKGSERYTVLERLNARNGEDFSDPSVCRRVCKLQEMWSSVHYF
jgi:hypothetical protein